MRAALLLLVACAHARPANETDIEALTDRALDAFDRQDAAALRALVADNHVRFEEDKLRPIALDKYPATSQPPTSTRTWVDRHVYPRGDEAVFVGHSLEKEIGNEVHGDRVYDGWYTLVWVHEHDDWRLAFSSWQIAGDSSRAAWNANFQQSVGFKHEPNQLLIDSVRGVTPGAALDVAMGQGRNALYLASQGWKVTGVDISDEGIAQARAEADKRSLSLATIRQDADAFDYGTERWDLGSPPIYCRARILKARREDRAPSIRHGVACSCSSTSPTSSSRASSRSCSPVKIRTRIWRDGRGRRCGLPTGR